MFRLLTSTLLALAPGYAQAQSLIQVLAHPTDLASEHVFVENPAAVMDKNDVATLAGAVVPGDDSFGGDTEEAMGEGVPERREGYMLGAAYGTKVSGGSAFGVLFENVSLRRDERGTVANRYEARYLQGRFATDVTSNLKFGILAHGYAFGMQEMTFSDGVTSDGEGSVLGLGAGVIFGGNNTMLGVTWLPAMRGKVEAEGESRIVTRSQIFNVQLVLPISSKGQWGFGARIRDKDEDAEFDMVHREYPEGEAPFFSGSVGWRLHTSNRWLMYLMASRDGYERGVDRRANDGSVDSSWATRLKLALGSDQGDRESYLQVVGRAVEEDDPAGGTKRVIADIHYCGVLSVKL
jgi:hypothetical protein